MSQGTRSPGVQFTCFRCSRRFDNALECNSHMMDHLLGGTNSPPSEPLSPLPESILMTDPPLGGDTHACSQCHRTFGSQRECNLHMTEHLLQMIGGGQV